MTILVPEELKNFWDALPGLPELRLAYTEDAALPQAVYRSTGFARERLNGGFAEDVHRYEITIISDAPEVAYEAGMDAALSLDAFAPPGIVHTRVQPEQWAMPMNAGQLDVWVFKINLVIRIVPA